MCLSWSKPIPGSSKGFCFFQAASLVSTRSVQRGFSESDAQPSLVFPLVRVEPSESAHFQELPQAVFTFCLKASLQDGIVQPQRKLLPTTRSVDAHPWVGAIRCQ